jgi:Tol biopolymer transport system component
MLSLWDVATGQQRWQMSLLSTEFAWSPDSKYLAVTEPAEGAVLVDSATGKVVYTSFASGGNLAWSPDGTLLACANGFVIFVMKAT